MLSRAWNFVKRHHRKGLATLAIIGGGAVVTRYALEKLKEYRQKDMVEYFENFRRDNHYETTQETCNQTVLSLVNNLRANIIEILDSEILTNLLKTKPENKIQLWEELKLISFTRVVASIYGTSMLVLLLRTQINIVGGYIYLNSISRDNEHCMSSNEMQEKFLDCVHYFLHDGLKHLIEIMKPSIENVINSISLTQKLTLEKLEMIFKLIRTSFENESDIYNNLNSFLITPEHEGNGDGIQDLSLNQIFNETRDILRSEDCSRVLNEAVNVGFANLFDLLTGFYSESGRNDQNCFVNPHEVTVPMAKLIPALNNFVFVQCSDQPKHLPETLLQFGLLKSFGANVFDAFSKPYTNGKN